ncbi:TonB-dependent receptor [Tunicatimonas pelagia]|uniref:TonB-dependent receptor n=1 Tax=Tunicatimonas pelagia TaxID=931531 RepID=UPI0026653C91|nr:TonB-dependent receptor [Tunicatimonas pelagia]WKN43013.1 TonB-dependent receptor [Tunicatimonas pelagia]
MNKFILMFLLLFLGAGALLAQTNLGTIQGTITDKDNNPIPGLNAALRGTTLGNVTDADGEFTIGEIPTGSYQLMISGVGYQTQRRSVNVTEGQTLQLDFTLQPSLTQLQEVEITGRKETTYQNEVSFIGSKTATPLQDVPQSVSYVTKELILDQAAFRVNDVVKNMSGVNQYSFYNDITIRGFRVAGQRNSGNLINGMRAFTSFWKQQLIPHIERVEVIKGPASALFGNASPGGTINRVTKKPLDETRQSITATVGSFGTLRTLADFTGPMTEDGTLLYRLNLGYENADSFRDLQYDNNLIVAPSFSFLPNDATRLNVDVVYQSSDGRLDRGQAVFGDGDLFSVPITKALNAANDYLREESLNATLSFQHQFTDRIKFNSVYLHSNYREDLQEHRAANRFAALGDGGIDPEQVAMQAFIRRRNWSNDNFNNYLTLDLTTGPLEHQLLVGYDYFRQTLKPGGSQLQARRYLLADRTGTSNFDPENADAFALDEAGNPIPNVPHFDLTDPFANQIRDMSDYVYDTRLFPQSLLHNHGIYLQNQVTWGPLQVLIGLRQEYYIDELDYRTEDEERVSQDAFIPRLGLVYELSDRINLYGTYVEGYQPQSASVINDPDAGGPFDPLISNLIEFGAKTQWMDDRLSATLAIYRLRQEGALYNANDPDNPDRQVQIGEEQSQGIELDITGQILPNWSIVANYAFNEAVIQVSDDETEENRQKPNAPRHTGNLWTKYVIDRGAFAGLGIGVGINLVTERFGSIVPEGENPPLFPGYEVVDAALYYQLDKFRIQVNVNNVLDQTHWVGGYDFIRAFPGAPRNLLTTISYTF